MRVPHHQYFGEGAVSVEDVLTRVFTDVDQPIEILKGDEGGVHINATVFGNQRQSVKV